MSRFVRTACGTVALVLVACGPVDDGSHGSGQPEGWPRELVTSEGTGPALYLHEGSNSPAIGYVSPGVRIRIAGAPEGDRIPVRIDGPLKVRGWLAVSRLAARVQQRGKVAGTPAYVGPNDLVGIRGSAGAGNLRVEVEPWLGRANAATLGPFVGEYPGDRLAATEVDPAHAEGPSSGQPATLPPSTEVPVYERPGGEVVATLPALDPPLTVVVLRESGEWKGVRVGVGPYLIGYVNVALTPTDEAPEGHGLVGEAINTGDLPARLTAEAERPLWKLAAGARVRFDGRTIAIFEEDGFAREMNRYPTGEVDVFVAVNDDVAIRGMVQSGDLQPYDGPPPVVPTDPAEEPAEPTAPTPPPSPEGYTPEAPPSPEGYTPEPPPPAPAPAPAPNPAPAP